MSATLRVVRTAAGAAAPHGFEALGQRMNGSPDSDSSEGLVRLVAMRGSDVVARASLQVVEGLTAAPGPSGLIGHYEAVELEAGVEALDCARDILSGTPAAHVLGPMNGSTWRRYRLALPSQPGDPVFDPPLFMGEPQNRLDYASHFEAAGFAVRSRYESRVAPLPSAQADPLKSNEAKAAAAGVRIRELNVDRFDEELRSMFDLTLESFADNLFYSPIGFTEFRAMYEPLRPILDPRLVLLLEDDSRQVVGYMFGFDDLLSDRGDGPSRSIAKTMAVSPAMRGTGLGRLLFQKLSQVVADRGRSQLIHALMHVDNFSRRLSSDFESRLFRRYALYEWCP